MDYKTLDDFSFKGKRVLLRSDINSEISDKKVILNDRIIESAKTIKELQQKGASVVVLAHQGRPGKKDFISLKQHSKLLNKYVKIKFVPSIIKDKALNEIKNLKNGEALLLENIRFLKEEFTPPDNKIVKTLSPLFDYYVNDAFSVSHREQTSIVGFPKILRSCIGRVMEKELKNLDKIKINNCLFILGGAKAEENILLLKNKNVLTCGIFGQLCVIAKGKNLGAQNKFLKDELKIILQLKRNLHKGVITPADFALKIKNKRAELSISEFPSKYEIFDIGEKTQEIYIDKIKNAEAVFMKGTAGYCEEKQFCRGTKSILNAISNSGAFSIICGGHLTSALRKLKINKDKFDYISLSGGATVEYIAGKKLPGLEVLKREHDKI
ncbi:MAG: phosphoglycerate kinase [Nanoarchaeota archaeon]